MSGLVRSMGRGGRARSATFAGLVGALVLIAVGATGTWLEYRVRVRCFLGECNGETVAEPIATESAASLPATWIVALLVVLAISSLIVLGGHGKFGLLAMGGGVVLAGLPFLLAGRIVVERITDTTIFYESLLQPSAYAVVLGGVVLIVLGGYLRSRWIERNVPAVNDRGRPGVRP